MSMRKFAGMIAGALFAVVAMAPLARAGQMDQLTKMTFVHPVEIPGFVLGPGTYYFTRVDNGNSSDLNLIQIYNTKYDPLNIVLQTIPVDRSRNESHTVLTFAKSAEGNPPQLLDWFYPGTQVGHQFLYSPREERRINESRDVTVAASRSGDRPIRSQNEALYG